MLAKLAWSGREKDGKEGQGDNLTVPGACDSHLLGLELSDCSRRVKLMVS